MNPILADRITSFLTESQVSNPRPELTNEVKVQFRRLACNLSPENLCCDGEISQAQAKVKERKLLAEWKKLEQAVGRQVGQEEAWSFVIAGKVW